MMKIAYAIIDCDGRDGTAVAMAHVMHRMADKGHDVTLLAANADGADLKRVKWQRVRALADPSVARFTSFYLNCSRVVRRLGMGAFDILHSAGCNTRGANVYQIQNVQPAKRTVLESEGSFRSGGLARTLARRAYYAVTEKAERRLYQTNKDPRVGGVGEDIHYLPVSNGTATELQHYFHLHPSSMTVVANGVDLERFSPQNRNLYRGPTRQTLGLGQDELVLLFVGGEWRRKGLHHAIDAISHLSTPCHPGGFRLVIAGVDAAKVEFVNQAKQLRVLDRLVFAGFIKETERLYAAADLFVFPTYYEAYSLASLEAASAGLPIIAAKTNGTEELVQPGVINQIGENGALIDRDGHAIAHVLNQLAASPTLVERLGRRSREIAISKHNWDRIAAEIESVYERIVARAAVTVPVLSQTQASWRDVRCPQA